MKTKYLQKNADTGQTEAFVSLSIDEILLIRDAIGVYKGDSDDNNVIATKKELNEGLHIAWKQLRPS